MIDMHGLSGQELAELQAQADRLRQSRKLVMALEAVSDMLLEDSQLASPEMAQLVGRQMHPHHVALLYRFALWMGQVPRPETLAPPPLEESVAHRMRKPQATAQDKPRSWVMGLAGFFALFGAA